MKIDNNNRLYNSILKQIEIMSALRTPKTGCPWDIEQDFDTIAPYTIEEAYEVADAIKKRDYGALKEELGDLIFQVAFHSRMAEEEGLFDFADVVESINDKMIARHEHVFGTKEIANSDDVLKNWENLKAKEREKKLENDNSVLADVASALPELMRAHKLSKRAARVGFDWPDYKQIFEKLDEEITEVKEAIDSNDKNHIEEEIGDCLFVLVNLARKFEIDPETALRKTNAKFESRFRAIENALEQIGKTPNEASLDEMENLWVKAKIEERK